MKYMEAISEIDSVMGRINTHPEYSGCVLREKYKAIREEAEKHSLAIELDSEGLNDKIHGNKDRTKFLRRLKSAEDYLLREGVDQITLSKLGHMIAPRNHPYEGFRRIGGVIINSREGASYKTPEPVEVMPQIFDLVDFLRNSQFHPVVRASNAHMEMVRIHPYEDGNGRAARLLQNLCLQERGYPPAVIHADERRDYFKVIGDLWKDRIERTSSPYNPSRAENEFYDFIASKVLDSAVQLENELKGRRMYNISLEGVENFGAVRTLANRIRSHGKIFSGSGLSVAVNKKNSFKKGSSLRVTGDITQEELRKALSKFAVDYGIKFTINLNKKFC